MPGTGTSTYRRARLRHSSLNSWRVPPPTIQVWVAFYCEDKIEEYEFKNQDELDGWLRGIDATPAENARWFKTKKEAMARLSGGRNDSTRNGAAIDYLTRFDSHFHRH